MMKVRSESSARLWIAALALILAGGAGASASAQSSASSYSYGTYNPVQAAINRNSMNEAIRRQAAGGSHKVTRKSVRHAKVHTSSR